MSDRLQQLGHLAGIALGIFGKTRPFCGPLWVQIGVSNRCNYRCLMCWDHPSFVSREDPYPDPAASRFYREHPEVDRSSALMGLELFRETVEDLHALGTRRVDLVGRGEPFLNRELVPMVSLVKRNRMYCNISTNGSLLNREILETLQREGLDQLVVSLNAGTPDTYGKIHTAQSGAAFSRIRASLLQLREIKSRKGARKPFLTLSFVLFKPNYQEIGSMLATAREVGAQQVIFKHAVVYPGISFLDLSDAEKTLLDQELMDLEKQALRWGIDLKLDPPIGSYRHQAAGPLSPREIYAKIPCYIGWLFSLVTADGTVLPCCHCYSSMGNIRDGSFGRIWRSPSYRDFREQTIRLPQSGGLVSQCRCDACTFTKYNLSLYNYLHPFRRFSFSEAQREYPLGGVLASVVSQKATTGPRFLAGRFRTKNRK